MYAQYPQYFTYNDENGLPSNEIYSIIQDNKGFIWIGCDAGLIKFDGVRYTSYKCKTQKSKSITGLTVSSAGKIYCYNFQSQIFVFEDDTLKELTHLYQKVPSIVCDASGNLIVNHNKGISVYNESNKIWQNYFDFTDDNGNKKKLLFTNSVRLSHENIACFITGYGIGKIKQNRLYISEKELFNHTHPSGTFILECFKDEQWVFSVNKNIIYRIINEKAELVTYSNLNRALQNRKITNVKSLTDGNIWICTYNGMLQTTR